jgi:hypothetical protein
MRLRRSSVATCALVTLEALGCGDVVSQPIGFAAGGDGGDGATLHRGSATEAGADAASTLGDAGSQTFCAGRGPIPLPGSSACVGDLSDVFRFAACACKSLDVSGAFSSDSFNSTSDAGPASGDLASIGSNGEISTNSRLTLAGSLWAGGPAPDGGPAVTLGGGVSAGGTIAHDVHSAADVQVDGKYLVGGSVWANGNVTLGPGGSLAVLGTLTVPTGDFTAGVQATVVNAPVASTAPCSCAAPVDIAAVVAAYASGSDDSLIGLATNESLTGAVALPCGRYYVAGIDGDTVALQVDGRVALFVAGDIAVTQDLSIELAPGAELDLFVAGSVSIMGGFEIGNADSPSRTRMYVGGATLALSANASPLAANIYAPNAVLELASDLEMWGSIFADHVQLSGDFAIHYDTSVLQVAAASGCARAAGPCQSCNDCSGATPACKTGTCAPCTTTADCCAPLGCDSSGRCVLEIP